MRANPVRYLSRNWTPQQIAECFKATKVLEKRFGHCTKKEMKKIRGMSPKNFLGILTVPELEIICSWLEKNYPTRPKIIEDKEIQRDYEILRPNRSIIY